MWSAAALPSLVAIVAILTHRRWMGSIRLNLPLLGSVVVVALVPLWLRLIDTMVDSAGSLELPGGIKLGFANARKAAQEPKEELKVTANLGGVRGAAVNDSGGSVILDSLRPATAHEIAVVDLGEGDMWWRTRLLLLCLGAQRLGNPTTIVFLGTEAGVTERFVGWADSGDVARRLLRGGSKAMTDGYRRASAMTMRLALGTPALADPNRVEMPWAPMHGATAAPPTPALEWTGPDWQMAPERQLMENFASLENSMLESSPSELLLTVWGIRDQLGPILRTASVDVAMDDEAWVRRVLCGREKHVAVTDCGVYRYLVSRDRAMSAVIGSLLDPPLNCAGECAG